MLAAQSCLTLCDSHGLYSTTSLKDSDWEAEKGVEGRVGGRGEEGGEKGRRE